MAADAAQLSASSSNGANALFVLAVYLLLFILMQKKKLPSSWVLPLSKFYFYPMVPANYLWRLVVVRGTYFSRVDDTLLLGAVPLACVGHATQLHRLGVRGVINLMAEYPGPVNTYAALAPPIEQLYFAVTDHEEPSTDVLEECVAFIAKYQAAGSQVPPFPALRTPGTPALDPTNGHPGSPRTVPTLGPRQVLVHCKGGHGRSAAVALAWLLSEHGGGFTPEQAQTKLSSVRHVRKKLGEQSNIRSFSSRRQAAKGGTKEML